MSNRTSIIVFSLILLAASFARGQGGVSTGTPVATNGVGQPLAGLTVAICNANPGASPSSLCSGGALVQTYTDVTLAHTCTGTLTALNNQFSPTVQSGCSNPGLTDGLGNVVAFASPGTYWCEYQGNPLASIQVSVCVFDAGSGSGGTLTSVATGAGLQGGPCMTTCTVSIATGGVTNAMLANPSTTVNGTVCTLGLTCSISASGGGGNPTLDNCTPDQTGNSFYGVTSLTEYFNASWQFIFSTSTYFNCMVYVPTAQTGATIVLDVAANDSTAGHTANLQTCDEVVNAGTINPGSALTCAAAQTFTPTSTAYNRVTLTFNVQSTLSNGSILLVKILTTPTGTAPTQNLLVYPHFVL